MPAAADAASVDAVDEAVDSAAPAGDGEAGPAEPAAPPANAPKLDLSDKHRKLIEGSAISEEVALARGYRTIRTKVELERLGFAPSQRSVPALYVPNFNATGEPVGGQIRPDRPRVVDGKPLKYETAKGAKLVVDVPPGALQWIRDPARPLFITEGARKADAAVSAGLCCIDLLGVWGFRGRNEYGGSTTLPDWGSIALKDREIYIVFDSDVMLKPSVHGALVALAGFLKLKGAKVRYVYLPAGDGGAKVGLDDYLAAGHTVSDLILLARSEAVEPEHGEEAPDYFEREGRTYWRKVSASDEVTEVELMSFTAKIEAEIEEDDGVEVRRSLELVAKVGERELRCRIASVTFESMGWVIPHLGVSAIVGPGNGIRDRARAAIQRLSPSPARRVVYQHTGWRALPLRGWAYLHAGGAIGANGAILETETSLPDALGLYALPVPPTGQVLIDSVRCVLRLLELGAVRVVYALIALAMRAAVGGSNAAMHIAGPTGAFKTEVASLIQRFWGKGMDAAHLPGSWSSTGNAIEVTAFHAKDAALVVDDFAPRGGASDIQRTHNQADRVFRAQGNRSARARLRSDGSSIPKRPPRCVLISTGEEIPLGQSLRARVLIAEIADGEISALQLTRCQADAAAGHYAAAMSGFICWLAGRHDEQRAQVDARALDLRATASTSEQHRRTPELIAQIQAGFESFLSFAIQAAAVTEDDAGAHRDACWAALVALGKEQGEHVESSEPTTVFFRLLRSALSSGEAHVQPLDAPKPTVDVAVHLGWHPIEPSHELAGSGALVGWVRGDDLYLDPTASHKAAQRMAGDGDRLGIGWKTLGKRLGERGLLLTRDEGKDRNTTRITVGRVRPSAYHVRLSHLLGTSQSPQSAPAQGQDAWERDRGGDSRGDSPAARGTTAPETAPANPAGGAADGDRGANGAVGAEPGSDPSGSHEADDEGPFEP